jgi:hypothetical protein
MRGAAAHPLALQGSVSVMRAGMMDNFPAFATGENKLESI